MIDRCPKVVIQCLECSKLEPLTLIAELPDDPEHRTGQIVLKEPADWEISDLLKVFICEDSYGDGSYTEKILKHGHCPQCKTSKKGNV